MEIDDDIISDSPSYQQILNHLMETEEENELIQPASFFSFILNEKEAQPQEQKVITKKRATSTRPRSIVWDHFDIISVGGEKKSKCKHCGKEYFCDAKKNGTSSLQHHITVCLKLPARLEARQKLLNLQPLKNETENNVGCLTTWKFDQKAIRKAISYMIVVDELPFKFVEREGFKHLLSIACPRFKMPSRFTVSRDCYDLYLDEKKKIQKFLHKKNINFCPVSSHKSADIGFEIENCLKEWGIENENVFTITMDNASSNDTAIKFLKEQFVDSKNCILKCEYLHMRCIAHIINLVVNDGLKEIGESVKKIRLAVRFIRQSPARLKRFKECVASEKIQSKSLLCLDVPTRWNSTYLMLHAAQKFEKAFSRFNTLDPSFSLDLASEGGCPLKMIGEMLEE
ncbi:zinc finger BED domain-containing protein RICESLEEPER 2-like [Mercurialis annua]|uniref:zinc finger BED domain-containing protein RICESLEEPER 2-like n=1 Tax=Mercurialis annua TaxID=3986 RepID=UPI00215F559F|nr:zinc finger BED domain-containing protein RICESLEEPER 2-like [Mercurialis annua]